MVTLGYYTYFNLFEGFSNIGPMFYATAVFSIRRTCSTISLARYPSCLCSAAPAINDSIVHAVTGNISPLTVTVVALSCVLCLLPGDDNAVQTVLTHVVIVLLGCRSEVIYGIVNVFGAR